MKRTDIGLRPRPKVVVTNDEPRPSDAPKASLEVAIDNTVDQEGLLRDRLANAMMNADFKEMGNVMTMMVKYQIDLSHMVMIYGAPDESH